MRIWLASLFALTLAAQTPSFEVASIRPSNSLVTPRPLCGSSVFVSPGVVLSPESLLSSGVYRLDISISEAYYNEVDDFDLPQWTRNGGTFAVSVKIPPNTSVDTCRKMLHNFLVERFHMITGVETRDVNRYFLKVAKSGLKLKPVGNPLADLNESVKFEVKDGVDRHIFHGAPMSKVVTSLVGLASVEAFALSFRLAGVDSIVDETGLTGYYDGEYKYNYSVASRRDEFAESIGDVLSRQLGLTLELRKTPGRVLVLRSSDHMPTEN